MFKRCIARPSLYTQAPRRCPLTPLRYKSNIPESAPKQEHPKSDNGNSNKKKPESWARFIGTRVGAIAGGYVVGKVYYYYNPKPDEDFTSYELTSRDPISLTLSIFTLRPKSNTTTTEEITQAWASGIWNLQFKQPQLQILRAYTPIPLGRVEDTNELQFLIRRDPRGEVSGYLHRLPPGSEITMRGPNIEYPLPPTTTNVLFIAGGTGIAPALQVAHVMFQSSSSSSSAFSSIPISPSDQPQKNLHILWANRTKEDTLHTTNHPNPVVAHLNNLTTTHSHTHSPTQPIQITYFTDEEQTHITPSSISSALDQLGPTSDTTIIISGPEGFISYLAGPKVWQDGKERQGPLGGLLAGVLAEREGRKGREEGARGKVKVWKV